MRILLLCSTLILTLFGRTSFATAIDAHVLRMAKTIPVDNPGATLSSLESLRSSYVPMNSDQKAAAATVLGAFAVAPADLPAHLASAQIPEAASAQLQTISAQIEAAAQKDPAVASRVGAFKASLGGVSQIGSVADAIRKSLSANIKALLDERSNVSFGEASLPMIGMPTLGDDFAALWTHAHSQSDSLLIAAYNFDDMDMAKSIVDASKAGKKVVFVGDYSNWFPRPAAKGGHGAEPRTAAMNYVLANLNPNLELHILKGLGSIGINHNKFSVFSRDGQELAQSGSFNYTKSSQNNHFENFVFTDDPDRIEFFKAYHAWLVRRARPFVEGMQAQDPTFPANDPIPVDSSRLKTLPLPKEVGTPKSEAGSWLVEFYGQAKAEIFGAMFALFPTPAEVAAIEEKLAAGIAVNFIVDHEQVSRATAVWGLLEKGMKLRLLGGPEEVIYGLPIDPRHSKMHMKVVTIDGGRGAKGADSLNESKNAEEHSFENLGFWEDYVARLLSAYIKEVMWPLASEPSPETLHQLQSAHALEQESSSSGNQ